MPPEFNDTKHVKGIVSLARGDDPGERSDVVLHLHRTVDRARRRLHGVRTGRRRHGGRRGDRGRAADRRDAQHRIDLKTVRVVKAER